MTEAKPKVALYVRVSTKEQNVRRQTSDLMEYAKQQNYDVTHIIEEKETAFRKELWQRASIQALRELVNQRAIDKVLISEISRLGRKTKEVLDVLTLLMESKISLVVLQLKLETLRPDLSPDPYAQFLLTVMADIGRLESENMSYRIKSGQKRAKKEGKFPGRPKGATKSIEETKGYKEIKRLLEKGHSVTHIKKIVAVDHKTVQKIKKSLKPTPKTA